ncbi:3706_t:CDS:2 [Entrophospora sp. SA101]|nr:3706_t:CDS:2 [Entrophospora sp. SA101]
MVNDDGFSWNFLFERITKVTVPVLFNDRDKFRFVVDIQICINSLSQIKPQETAGKIEQLRLDHSYNKFNPSSKDLTDLIPFKLHIPQKTKTKKVPDDNVVAAASTSTEETGTKFNHDKSLKFFKENKDWSLSKYIDHMESQLNDVEKPIC